MPQPDTLLLILPNCGGQAIISADDYLEGAPELAGEVAATSASYDLNVKKEAYRRNRVQEYLIWRVLDHALDWLVLRKAQYDHLLSDAEGISKSLTFPGLWLDPQALLIGDMARVLEFLELGISSPEHADFVERLARAAAAKKPG